MSLKTVHYLCFYAEEDNKDILISYPSVWSKIDYIVDSIKEQGYKVNLLSAASINKRGIYKKRDFFIDNNENHHYFTSFNISNKYINKLNILFIWFQLIVYIITNMKKGDKLLVYHSLFYNKPIKFLSRVFKKKFYLEIEDVYSALNSQNKKFEKEEWEFFKYAEGYLCVNDLIAEKLSNDKKKVISYGNYNTPINYNNHDIDLTNIKLVYAGVIEQERNAAFLAIDAMKYLPSNYTLNILGFGNESDINAMKYKIKKINNYLKREAVVFHGRMEGEEYHRFLQGCDIALSTHAYDESNMDSADNTFPSKVLIYLGNNLRVVAQKLLCLEESAVSSKISFYDRPDPKQIANVILSIDLTKSFNSKNTITHLDNEFRYSFKELLEY